MALFSRGAVVPVLRFSGAIGLVSPLRPGLTLAGMAGVIERAFSVKGARAIALQINSPGGSPVQSTLLFTRIRALAEEKKLPVYVFAEDVAASGGYLLALAGDEIYADPSSVIGSIGVVSAGFGFPELLARLGIERRVYTAGEQKMTLDPFQPENPDDVARLKALQQDVHTTFINLVKTRRGDRIAAAGDKLFTGAFWSGRQALELGLIDGLSDLRSKMREKFGKKVKLKLVAPKKGLLPKLSPLTHIAGESGAWSPEAMPTPATTLPEELIAALETRMLWQRFGL